MLPGVPGWSEKMNNPEWANLHSNGVRRREIQLVTILIA